MGTAKFYRPPRRRFRVRLKFDYHSLWIGVFFKVIDYNEYAITEQDNVSCLVYTFYVCLIPTLPIVVEIRRNRDREEF